MNFIGLILSNTRVDSMLLTGASCSVCTGLYLEIHNDNLMIILYNDIYISYNAHFHYICVHWMLQWSCSYMQFIENIHIYNTHAHALKIIDIMCNEMHFSWVLSGTPPSALTQKKKWEQIYMKFHSIFALSTEIIERLFYHYSKIMTN